MVENKGPKRIDMLTIVIFLIIAVIIFGISQGLEDIFSLLVVAVIIGGSVFLLFSIMHSIIHSQEQKKIKAREVKEEAQRILGACKNDRCVYDAETKSWNFTSDNGEVRKFPKREQCIEHCFQKLVKGTGESKNIKG